MILGIGNDLVDSRRIDTTLKRYGARFLNRVFTQKEQVRIISRANQTMGYAKVFAMKESVLKALGTGLTTGIVWHDIEVVREGNQPPSVVLRGAALEVLKKKTPEGYTNHIHVSVSDEWPYAQAFAIVSITGL